jgi:hypothetical protein
MLKEKLILCQLKSIENYQNYINTNIVILTWNIAYQIAPDNWAPGINDLELN